jgi:hypothetical protein
MRVYRRIAFALALGALALPWPGSPALSQQAGAQQILCSRSLNFSLGATSITQIVAASTGQAIHVCSVVLNAGAAAATYQLTVGTGTNCNANTVNITPIFTLGINGVLAFNNTVAWYSTPVPLPPLPAYALCHTITGTGPMQALVLYHQF